MIWSIGALVDRKCPSHQGLRLVQLASVVGQEGEVAERRRELWMIRSKKPFLDSDGAPQHGFGFGGSVGALQQKSQIVQRGSDFGIIGSIDPFTDGEGPAIESLGFGGPLCVG